MARRKTKFEESLDNAELEPDAAAFVTDAPALAAALDHEPPADTSPAWSDYVKSQFADEELDSQGNPTADGLRRVVKLLLGEIIESKVEIPAAPSQTNGLYATVIYTVTIRYHNNPGDLRTFCDAADVNPENTDPNYARHAVASATTKAEGRVYRKALGLTKTLAAEEVAAPDLADTQLAGRISAAQIKGIDKLCRDLDINLMTFINSGENNYPQIDHVRHDKAIKMIEKLNTYFQNVQPIPDALKGYNPQWRKA